MVEKEFKITDIRKVCRICLEDDTPMRSLFEFNEFYRMSTVEIVLSCYNLQIEKTEELSNLICCNCNLELLQAYGFKLKYEKFNNCLQEYLIGLKKLKGKRRIVLLKLEKSEKGYKCEIKFPMSYSAGTLFDENFEDTYVQEESPKTVKQATKKIMCKCKQLFDTRAALLLHKKDKVHYSKKTQKFCNIQTITKNKVLKKPKHKCTICTKKFYRKYNLKRHILLYEDKLQEHALLADNAIQLKNHAYEKYQCYMCSKILSSKDILRRHIGIHQGKFCTCNVCNKIFTRAESLSLHTRIHTGERPYSCSVCLISFNKQQNLKRHMSTQHYRMRLYCCDMCNKQYSVKYNLTQHKLTHSKENDTTLRSICYKLLIPNLSSNNNSMPVFEIKN